MLPDSLLAGAGEWALRCGLKEVGREEMWSTILGFGKTLLSLTGGGVAADEGLER